MRLEEKSLLYDVCTACELILRFTAGKSYADYAADEACRSAVERQFITVGEAPNRLGKLNPPMAQKIPGNRAIVNFRNILVHGYDRIESEVVWGIVRTHVPVLHDTVLLLLRDPNHPEQA